MILKPPLGSLPDFGSSYAKGPSGLWLMNEGSGNIIQDLSGNGRDAIAVGATGEISWQPGPNGSVVDFVGDTITAFQFANPITFGATDPWTVVLTAQTDGDAAEGVFLGTYNAANDFLYFSEANYLRHRNSAGGDNDFTYYDYKTFAVWDTYAVIADGKGNLDLYAGGIFRQRLTGKTTTFIINCIGGAINSTSYVLDGRIGNVSIYNCALSASEILELCIDPFYQFRQDPIELWAAATVGGAVVVPTPYYRTLLQGDAA